VCKFFKKWQTTGAVTCMSQWQNRSLCDFNGPTAQVKNRPKKTDSITIFLKNSSVLFVLSFKNK